MLNIHFKWFHDHLFGQKSWFLDIFGLRNFSLGGVKYASIDAVFRTKYASIDAYSGWTKYASIDAYSVLNTCAIDADIRLLGFHCETKCVKYA